jgi:hypothetical protein
VRSEEHVCEFIVYIFQEPSLHFQCRHRILKIPQKSGRGIAFPKLQFMYQDEKVKRACEFF